MMNGEKGKTRRLIVFSRFPMPGETKTRLIPALGVEGAAELQRRMTRRIIGSMRQFAGKNAAEIEIRFTGGSEVIMRDEFGSRWIYREQGDGNLGERLIRAFKEAFSECAKYTVIIGSDCPAITTEILCDAFERLKTAELVIGPAFDGGYYLIGLRRPIPELFPDDMPWGESTVCRQTLDIARRLNLSISVLPELTDIDRPEDLASLAGSGLLDGIIPPEISVIIPALNEERNISPAIESARAPGVEIIVVDGGSADGTAACAEKAGAMIIRSRSGRARQMNAGAKLASGKILLFLHADTRLPENYVRHVTAALNRSGVAAGAFEFSLDITGPLIGIIEKMVNFRSRLLLLPYGDQAIFMRADSFREMGGFQEDLPIMEDVALIRRICARGRIYIVPALIVTSGRRWLERGVARNSLFNMCAVAAYYLGVSPDVLAKWLR